jgi:hypothetical protein
MAAASAALPNWQRFLRMAEVVVTAGVILGLIALLVSNDKPAWLIALPVLGFVIFAVTLWRSRGQFCGASRDHPVIARSHRGMVLSMTWLLLLTVALLERIVHDASWLLLGLNAIILIFIVGAVAEAASMVPRNDRGEQVSEGPAENLSAP